jgi:hypothetical protein
MRYHLFAGYNYYPDSGLGDYRGSFDEEADAIEAGKIGVSAKEFGPDWWVVITEQGGGLIESARGYRERD